MSHEKYVSNKINKRFTDYGKRDVVKPSKGAETNQSTNTVRGIKTHTADHEIYIYCQLFNE
jgi:hypothetical protein